MRRPPIIIQIDNILVAEEVFTEFFACDYEKCRGACCVIGDSGAPLKEEEIPHIERNYEGFEELLTEQGREIYAVKGGFEIDEEGDLVTPVVDFCHNIEGASDIPDCGDNLGGVGHAECAFSLFEKLNLNGEKKTCCLCAIERSFYNGKSDFKKPISCQLYPIRVSTMSDGSSAMNFHRWKICKDAFVKGRKENIRVYEFLKAPIIDTYGEDFYAQLCVAAEQIITIVEDKK